MSMNALAKHGFVRLAAVTTEVTICNPRINCKEIERVLKRLAKKGVEQATFSELPISGYTCGNLFHDLTLLEACKRELLALVKRTKKLNIMFAVGMPLMIGSDLFNVAVIISRGKIIGVVPKKYIPNYREFIERQFFDPAEVAKAKGITSVTIGEFTDIPFGTDLLFELRPGSDAVFNFPICEDSWVPVSPARIAALSGATILCNLSASNITIGKGNFRKIMMESDSGICMAATVYCSAGFGENTTNVSWDGQCLIAERGTILAENERFAQESNWIIQDIDAGSLVADRMQQKTFADNARDYAEPMRRISANIQEEKKGTVAFRERESLIRDVSPTPFVPDDPRTFDEHCLEAFKIQASALASRLRGLPEKGRKVVVGVSGGLDSTLALIVAVHAMDMLGLSRKNIIGITMPGPGTSKKTLKNARELMRLIGCTAEEHSIIEEVEKVCSQLGYNWKNDPDPKKTRWQNIQARTRTEYLFNRAGSDAIVLGTGDLSEILIGWCTYKADHFSSYNVNCTIPKTLVKFLTEWAANNVFGKERRLRDCIIDIVETEISPELLPPVKGEVSHSTESEVGSYRLLDFYMYYVIRFGRPPEVVYHLARHAFKDEFEDVEILKRLKQTYKRFFQSQFKRDCVPGGPKAGLVSLSPRSDWRMPTDAQAAIWVEEVERLETSL